MGNSIRHRKHLNHNNNNKNNYVPHYPQHVQPPSYINPAQPQSATPFSVPPPSHPHLAAANKMTSLPYSHVDSCLRALASQAEGFGRCAIGGLHGPLYCVTTLAGSLHFISFLLYVF